MECRPSPRTGELRLFPPAFVPAEPRRALACSRPLAPAANDRGPEPPRPKPMRARRPSASVAADAVATAEPLRWPPRVFPGL
jgi:hypothetical protein